MSVEPNRIPTESLPPYPHKKEDTVVPPAEHRDDKHEKKGLGKKLAIGVGAFGLAAATFFGVKAVGGNHNTAPTPGATPAATGEATPGQTTPSASPSEVVATPTPSESSSSPESYTTDPISEQLMSDAVTPDEFATYPQEARVKAGLSVIASMRDSWKGIDLFTADLPDGTNLWDNNPIDMPLDQYSSFEAAYFQNIFFQQLVAGQRANETGNAIDVNNAVKLSYAFSVDTESGVADMIGNYVKNGTKTEISRFSTETLATTKFPDNHPATKEKSVDASGKEVTTMTGTIRDQGDLFTLSYQYVPVPELGADKGVWINTGIKKQQ